MASPYFINLASFSFYHQREDLHSSTRPRQQQHNDDHDPYGSDPSGTAVVVVTAKQALTPKDKKKSIGKQVRSISDQFHSATLSPTVASPSLKYAGRTNLGKSVVQYGASDNTTWTANPDFHPEVKMLKDFEYLPLTKAYKFMFEKAETVGEVRNDLTLCLGDEMEDVMLDKEGEGGAERYTTLIEETEGMISTLGRIHCGPSTRLEADGIMFEGMMDSWRMGKVVPLDLSQVKGFSLFPGQIVGIKGTNSTGDKLHVQELVDGKVPPEPSSPITITPGTGPVQLVVAGGPFTTTSNLLYEPLSDFLTTVRDNPPHVLILLGPFLDAGHPLLVSNDLGETHDTIFKRCLRIIAKALEGTLTQVVLVPSSRDVCSSIVYPTPPYDVPGGNFIRVSDPALLDIEGVVVALTATDILFHIGKKEISTPPQTRDRLGRLAHHILKQRSFYPLYPAHEKMCVNSEKLDIYGQLPCKPHLFILPSGLRYFVKEVEGCVMVNPEHLAKGLTGGTYARIELRPPASGTGMTGAINADILKV
ncbi:DNA polymerase alpha subunit B [Chionoecetes opilio]|uniref:DNA polymerase alpha subunit B n=1 Tax=Chionoecetes opilio TaxID=41210 RepID=A0A8J8WBN7_CHIOP|nr:DNA polymerase alpha subunit B [Chionoecetes opilio]